MFNIDVKSQTNTQRHYKVYIFIPNPPHNQIDIHKKTGYNIRNLNFWIKPIKKGTNTIYKQMDYQVQRLKQEEGNIAVKSKVKKKRRCK